MTTNSNTTSYAADHSLDPFEERILKLFSVMKPFAQDIDGQWHDIWNVLSDDNPAAIDFRKLFAEWLSAVGDISIAAKKACLASDDDSPAIKAIFWHFLCRQIQCRAAVVRELSIARAQGSGDTNDVLSNQIDQLKQLEELLEQYEGWSQSVQVNTGEVDMDRSSAESVVAA